MRYKVRIGGLMGVPSYFIDAHLGDSQFELIDYIGRYPVLRSNGYTNPKGTYATMVKGECQYTRAIIRRKTR